MDSADDPNLETDVQFGVTKALIGEYVRSGDGFLLEHTFIVKRGDATLPPAPITGRNDGERPGLAVLARRE